MRIPRIYCDQPFSAGNALLLDTQASRHLCQVLRLEAGHPVELFDGRGQRADATLSLADKKQAVLQIDQCGEDLRTESPLPIHLGIGLSKGDRFEWVLQKATELGVSHITPLTSERTEVKLKAERADKKQQHWQQIIISACEQCGRNRLPQLLPITSLEQWIARSDADARWVLHPFEAYPLKDEKRPESAALLIGPEGGLSDGEVAKARAQGFQPLQLGPRILRTETAPVAAIAILQYQWGDI